MTRTATLASRAVVDRQKFATNPSNVSTKTSTTEFADGRVLSRATTAHHKSPFVTILLDTAKFPTVAQTHGARLTSKFASAKNSAYRTVRSASVFPDVALG